MLFWVKAQFLYIFSLSFRLDPPTYPFKLWACDLARDHLPGVLILAGIYGTLRFNGSNYLNFLLDYIGKYELSPALKQ